MKIINDTKVHNNHGQRIINIQQDPSSKTSDAILYKSINVNIYLGAFIQCVDI